MVESIATIAVDWTPYALGAAVAIGVLAGVFLAALRVMLRD